MNIAVIFGGLSYEHEISIVSAMSIQKAIKKPLSFIFLDKHKDLYLIDKNKMSSKIFINGDYKKSYKLTFAKGGFVKNNLLRSKITFSAVINSIHGQNGEDGTIPALFDFYGIPYIGPRLEASVISYNKLLTKKYAQIINVNTLPFKVYSRNNNIQKICDEVQCPIIIKPLRLGSSIGISVVKTKEELEYILDSAFEFDDKIIVEPFIENVKEYNLAGFRTNKEIHFSNIEEVKKKDFLNFDNKYLDFKRESKVKSADMTQDMQEKMHSVFKRIYVGCFDGALIRCDFFVINDEIYLNEINSTPGSMANYLFDDFDFVIELLLSFFPKTKNIDVQYKYLNKISKDK